ncbi:hypothetical protein QFC22_005170 [Naganishia vaughanmartiniae]|uniref:Uncharacterized protein n=1 Tax=Naganishia vaughanmartiniae TaxID=1424756 RepID=A0ACC2WVE2_9TREE|nr:hypothetical protein QFC22_005170 [Naganishia vaughanmartiniae]
MTCQQSARKLFARARPDLCQAIWKHVTTTDDLTYSAAKECMDYFRSTEQWEMVSVFSNSVYDPETHSSVSCLQSIKVTESIKNILKKERRDLALHPHCDRPAEQAIREPLPLSRRCPPPIPEYSHDQRSVPNKSAQKTSSASHDPAGQSSDRTHHRSVVEVTLSERSSTILGEAVQERTLSHKSPSPTGSAQSQTLPAAFGSPSIENNNENQCSRLTIPNMSCGEERVSGHDLEKRRKNIQDMGRQSLRKSGEDAKSWTMRKQDSPRVPDKGSPSADTITDDGTQIRFESVESIEEDVPESSASGAIRCVNRASDMASFTAISPAKTTNEDSARVKVVVPASASEVEKVERPTTRSMVSSPLQLRQEIIVKQERNSIAASNALRDSAGRFLPISPKASVSQGKSARAARCDASAAPSPSRSKVKLPQNRVVGRPEGSGRKAQQCTGQPNQPAPTSEEGLLKILVDLVSAENARRARNLERHSSTK